MRLRLKASKYLSQITHYLPSDLRSSILSELLSILTDTFSPEVVHGCCYTLAALCYTHSIEDQSVTTMLPTLLSLLSEYIKQPSTSDTSLVFDSICYVLWSCARQYASILLPSLSSLLAVLILLATTNPEVNVRRAAAAVIQELIGRVGAENVEAGIELINTLSFAALAQIYYTYFHESRMTCSMTVVLPKVARISSFRDILVTHLRWMAENVEDFGMAQLAGKALFFITPEIEPISDWQSFSPRVVDGKLVVLANTIAGFALKRQQLSITTMQQVMSLILHPPNLEISRGEPVLRRRECLLYLLKSVVLSIIMAKSEGVSSEEVVLAFKTLFPLSFSFSKWCTRDMEFHIEEQCLWVVSEWFFRHQLIQGIDYCTQLAKAAIQTGSEYGIHILGSIWWEITLPLLPSLIDQLLIKHPPEIQEAFVTIIGRLLWVQPHTDAWSQLVKNWAKAGCTCYTREIRGDVGSWTRLATISGMVEILHSCELGFDLLELKGYRKLGLTEEGETLVQFQPLTLGSCIFPDGNMVMLNGNKSENEDKVTLPNDVLNCFVELSLKQLAEQHTKIRCKAALLLSKISGDTPLLQCVRIAFPQQVLSPDSLSQSDLFHHVVMAVKEPMLRPLLLRGLIYTVGGNTPVITEQVSKELVALISDETIAKEVIPELATILIEESKAGHNGYLPALRTFIVCSESVDLETVLSEPERETLQILIKQWAEHYCKKIVVVKSLLDLYSLLLPTWSVSKEYISTGIVFLTSSFPTVRKHILVDSRYAKMLRSPYTCILL